jgi:hypothetical protein
MRRTVRFDIEYVGGIWQATKSKKGFVSVDKDGFVVAVGSLAMADTYFIPWNCVVAINLTGSSNPAFQNVPTYLTGIPGLQTMSTKSVRTGARCFIAVGYTAIARTNFPKATSHTPNTLRMYALDMNQSDIETHLAQYMHIVDQNAEQFAATQDSSSSKTNERRGVPKVGVSEESIEDDRADSRGQQGRSEKSASLTLSKSLKELATMYKQGLLTKKEFEQAKRKLLK